MITVEKIKELNSLSEMSVSNYDMVFYGDAIDDRTRAVGEIIQRADADVVIKIKYDAELFLIYLNDDAYSPARLSKFFIGKNFSSIFIDSTSLDFPEIVYLLQSIRAASVDCEIVVSYLEPYDYRQSSEKIDRESIGILEQEFNLSDKKGNFAYLPSFAINSSQTEKATLITTLGFESSRLGQLLEQDDGFAYDRIEAYFGIPAYKPGWENRSIYKHMRYLSTDSAEIKLFPACNPYEFYKQLSDLTRAKNTRHIVFAPMGTKPALLAICIFLVNNWNKTIHKFGALYDFPKKSINRSNGVGKVYSYYLRYKCQTKS